MTSRSSRVRKGCERDQQYGRHHSCTDDTYTCLSLLALSLRLSSFPSSRMRYPLLNSRSFGLPLQILRCSPPITSIPRRCDGMPKRKRSSAAVAAVVAGMTEAVPPPSMISGKVPSPPRRITSRTTSRTTKVAPNPERKTRALENLSGGTVSLDEQTNGVINMKMQAPESPLSDPPSDMGPPAKQRKARNSKKVDEGRDAPAIPAKKTSASKHAGVETLGDPEAEGDEEAGEEEIQQALSRPPPVNSDYLPLPWKGRLGYVS